MDKDCEGMAQSGKGEEDKAKLAGRGVDEARFREAMSRITASVHIIATDGPAGLAGLTATAVASITCEPPMMLFCINQSSLSAARMIENGAFCINTLSSSQARLADIFAGRTGEHLEQRFTHGEWTKLVTGCPVLHGAAAVFDCRLVEAKEVTTHLVMIGMVEEVDFGSQEAALTYVNRKCVS